MVHPEQESPLKSTPLAAMEEEEGPEEEDDDDIIDAGAIDDLEGRLPDLLPSHICIY